MTEQTQRTPEAQGLQNVVITMPDRYTVITRNTVSTLSKEGVILTSRNLNATRFNSELQRILDMVADIANRSSKNGEQYSFTVTYNDPKYIG